MASRKTSDTEAVVDKQRKIQHEQDANDRLSEAKGKQEKPAVQAGHHAEPQNPLPRQRLEKPGTEAKMQLRPRFLAPDYKGSGKLEGLTALVTGGDSGIGRSVAVLFAREGADVVIVYLDEHEDAEETKKHIEDEGRRCVLVAGDVRDAAFCEQAVKKTVQTFGRLDLLVNNAAFQMHAAGIEELTDERLDLTLQTNIGGYFRMTRAALPHLKKGASIINTGSVTGLQGSGHLHQGRDPRLHQGAGQQPAAQGHPCECSSARPGVDAAEPGRPAGREDRPLRRADRHGPPRAARGTVAGLRVPCSALLLELHHRHRAARHRQRRRHLSP